MEQEVENLFGHDHHDKVAPLLGIRGGDRQPSFHAAGKRSTSASPGP